MTKILGVIHARGGSVRIPMKNIKLLNGKPLLAYSIEAALKSFYLQRIIVSTDNEEIMKVALKYGAEVPFTRPKEISWGCPSEHVTQHAVAFIEREQGEIIEIAVTMQPTTPFVSSNDIDDCIGELLLSGADSCFSSKLISERPEFMFIKDEQVGSYMPILGKAIQGERGISQLLPKIIIPNGAVYATRRDTLMNDGVIIGPNSSTVIMPPERSIDIDEPLDFEFAEFLSRRN